MRRIQNLKSKWMRERKEAANVDQDTEDSLTWPCLEPLASAGGLGGTSKSG